MTTTAIANEYVALFRRGKIDGDVMNRLFSPDIVRVEPVEPGQPPMELRGNEITDNMQRFIDSNEIHGVDVDGPYIFESRFAVRFAIDTTFRPTGERGTITKISLYTLEREQIVREEVFHAGPPPAATD